ncbi:MAG: outer membrane protein assembly factor BamD [Nonlabens sp.]
MKKLFFFIGVLLFIAACSPYQKALKSEDYNYKLVVIDTLMKKGKYTKSIDLFEQVLPKFRGTDSAAIVQIKYADALFGEKNYPNSAYQYERFVSSYPTDKQRERAAFMAARSHYEMSPVYSKDQTDTRVALAKLQDYINSNPDGEYAVQANELTTELRYKLDKKAFKIAKNYHHREAFVPAIATFENFIVDHPGSDYQDDAHFYLLDSEYRYAIKSQTAKVQERLDIATKYYNNFIKRYPDSEYRGDADEIMEKIETFESN